MGSKPPKGWKPSPEWRESEVQHNGTPSRHYRRGRFYAWLQDVRFSGVALGISADGWESLSREVYGDDSWRVAAHQAEALVNLLAAGDSAGGGR